MLLTRADIQQIIPHREPFVLVDGIVDLDPGRSATGVVRDVAEYGPLDCLRGRDSGPGGSVLVDTFRLDPSGAAAEGTIEDVAALQPLFEGHFPGSPIFPGVLLLAAAAEVAQHCITKAEPYREGVFLAGVDAWRFRRVVVPGDRLDLNAEPLAPGVVRARATVDGKTAAEGRLTFAPAARAPSPVPERPILPGHSMLLQALTIEALAQTGAVAALAATEHRDRIAFLAAIDGWEFHSPVEAGIELDLRAALTDMRQSFGKGHFRALAAGRPVAEGELVFGIG